MRFRLQIGDDAVLKIVQHGHRENIGKTREGTWAKTYIGAGCEASEGILAGLPAASQALHSLSQHIARKHV